MHIVHVPTRLDNGGAEENTITTAQQQAAAGHSVTVIHGGIAKPRWRDAWPKGVERVSLPNLVAPISPRLDWVAQRQLVEMFHALAPDGLRARELSERNWPWPSGGSSKLWIGSEESLQAYDTLGAAYILVQTAAESWLHRLWDVDERLLPEMTLWERMSE